MRRSKWHRPGRVWPPARRWSSRPCSIPARQRRSRSCSPTRAGRRSTTTAWSPIAPRPRSSRSTATRSDGRRPPASSPPSRARSKPVVAELWGSPTDTNAQWFKSGNDDILNPLFKSGKIVKGPQQFVPAWSANGEANGVFAQMLVKTNNKIDGVDRGERQHRRRRGRAAEGQAPEADPAQRAGCDRRGRAVHHLRLADRNGLQARAPAGERRGRGCDRAPQGQEAGHDHDQE